jgi:IS5 family transposase
MAKSILRRFVSAAKNIRRTVFQQPASEREASIEMVEEIPGDRAVTLGADKGYDTRDHVAQLRQRNVTPHVAQKKHSAIDGRTTRHAGYQVSQQKRKRVEEIFGWLKTVGMLRKTRHRGVRLVAWVFAFAAAAYNLVRVRNLASVLSPAVA